MAKGWVGLRKGHINVLVGTVFYGPGWETHIYNYYTWHGQGGLGGFSSLEKKSKKLTLSLKRVLTENFFATNFIPT